MAKIILDFGFIFSILYGSLNLFLFHINDKEIETEKIADKSWNRIFVSLAASFFIFILYRKYGVTLMFLKYFTLMIYLIVVGYINVYSKNVYTFISRSFLLLGVFFLTLGQLHVNLDFKYLLGCIACYLIASVLAELKIIGGGDAEVLTITAIYIGGIASIINIFLSICISFIAGILITLKHLKLTNQATFSPYIVVSTYLLLIFI